MNFDASIILCTINEIENLPVLVKKIENIANFNYQFVFVDDGSTDGTREFILDYCKGHSNAKYVFNVRGVISRVAKFLAIIILKNAKKTTDPLSGYFGFKKGLNLPINEKWRGYKILLFILSANPSAEVYDVPYVFLERVKGESKIAKGIDYIRIYLTEIFLAKRIEIRNKR